MSTKPEALRLAGELDEFNATLDRKAAAELRRQHAEIERLTAANRDLQDWFDAAKADLDKMTAERDALLAAAPKVQSFLEAHPHNSDAKCKCEHWQSCADCHPTAHAAPDPVVQHIPADDTEGGAL